MKLKINHQIISPLKSISFRWIIDILLFYWIFSFQISPFAATVTVTASKHSTWKLFPLTLQCGMLTIKGVLHKYKYLPFTTYTVFVCLSILYIFYATIFLNSFMFTTIVFIIKWKVSTETISICLDRNYTNYIFSIICAM